MFLPDCDVSDCFGTMTYFVIPGPFFFNLDSKAVCCGVAHAQGCCVGIVGCLHISQEERCLAKGTLMIVRVPGARHNVAGGADFKAHGANRALAGFPGNIVYGFIDMGTAVLLLLLEVVAEALLGDVVDPAADGVGSIFRDHSGHNHRCFVEPAGKRHVLRLAGTGKTACLNDGAVAQGGASFFHYQVAHGFAVMFTIQVIPLGHSDLETGFADVTDTYGGGIGIVDAGWPGYNNGVVEGVGKPYEYPVVGHFNLTCLQVDIRCQQFFFNHDGGVGCMTCTVVVGDCQAGGIGAGCSVGMGAVGTGGCAAVAEIPDIAGYATIGITGARAVKGNGQRQGTGGWCGGYHSRGCLVSVGRSRDHNGCAG